MREAVKVSEKSPVLLDRFLNDAIEVDVDCISDGTEVMIGGIMEHIEQAGVHSGDSACSLPPYSLPQALQDELRRQTVAMAQGAEGRRPDERAVRDPGRRGGDGDAVVYVLEVNPRASRTVPFVSKATGAAARQDRRALHGRPDARRARRACAARSMPPYFSVKEAVFPFIKFPGVDPILGPEMKSTGEVMGVGRTFGEAMLKSQLGAGSRLPTSGTVFISVQERRQAARRRGRARRCTTLGFQLVATRGTAAAIADGRRAGARRQQGQGGRPHIVDMLKNGEIQLVVNTVEETRTAIADSRHIRQRRAGPPRHLLHQHGRLRGGGRRHEAPRRPRPYVAAGTARRTALD